MAKRIGDRKTLSHEEWLALRRTGIGGSDAGAIAGMNEYSSAITVYADKKGLSKEIEDNEAMRLGRDLEQYVADRFMEETGKKVRNDFFVYADDEFSYMIADIDRRVVGENAGLECKTMSSFSHYNVPEGEIPSHYYAQCQHYMMVLGLEAMYIGILIYQRGFYWHRIERNDSFIAQLRAKEIEFWEGHVLKDDAPDPDGSEASMDTLKEMYPHPDKDTEIYITDLDRKIQEYKSYAEAEKQYKELKLQVQGVICNELGTTETGVGIDYGCSWKEQSKEYVPDKVLKEKYPEIYKELVQVSTYRVFRTKKFKKKGA